MNEITKRIAIKKIAIKRVLSEIKMGTCKKVKSYQIEHLKYFDPNK